MDRVKQLRGQEGTIQIKIGVLGAGAIGSLFGGLLSSVNTEHYEIDTVFFCREAHCNKINERGLILHDGPDILNLTNIKAYPNEIEFHDAVNIQSRKKFTYLFLTTKAYDIETAIYQYRKLIDECEWLVILQNGIGNEDLVRKGCSEEKIMRIVTSHGALIRKPGEVHHTGKGFTKIGFPFINSQDYSVSKHRRARDRLYLLQQLLEQCGIETEISDDIVKDSWEKVIANVGINPVGTLTRLKNGKILEHPNLLNIMESAIEEALIAAKSKRINLSDKDYMEIACDIARKTAENENSMLQDVLKNKQTEIDFINGKIVEIAEEFGIDCPVNKILTNLVKGLEDSYIL